MYSHPRNHVISYSVLFEYNLSFILCNLLDIDMSKSKSFGNENSSLSFSSKLNLLLDINVINESYKSKFQKIAEIRNQFAHNKDATDYTKCYSYINGAKNFLLKSYGKEINKSDEEEIQNAKLFTLLTNDLGKVLEKFVGAAVEKARNLERAEFNQKYLDTLNKFSKDDSVLESKLKDVYIAFKASIK